MVRGLGVSFFIVLILSSCVTNKKYTLLQNNDVNRDDLPTDTTVRVYGIMPYAYKIQANDLISVRFESLTPEEFDFFSKGIAQQNQVGNLNQGNALLIGELVDENGTIPFPVIGKVHVAGLSVFEVQDKLQMIANEYLESPVVKVRLLNYRVTVLGEVRREGTINIGNNRVSMLEAMGLAGGMTDLANRKNIKLIRQINNSVEVQYLNLLDEDFINSPYYYVHQNDVLIIPPLRQRPYRTYFSQNLSLLISALSLLLIVVSLNK